MRLESAITALRKSKKVKRKAWKDDFLVLGAVEFFDEFYVIKVNRNKYNAKAYVFNKDDIIARDWEVLNEEKYVF